MLGDLAPIEYKGPIGVSFQFFVTVGIMAMNLAGLPFLINPPNDDPKEGIFKMCDDISTYIDTNKDNSFFKHHYFRIYFAAPAVFALLQSLLLLTVFNYDSPKYLKMKGRVAELTLTMGKLYSSDQVQTRIESINVNQDQGEVVSMRDTLVDPRYRRATFIGIMLNVAQQFSGINIVMSYGGQFFNELFPGLGNWTQPMIGIANMLPVIPAYYLLLKFGRKSILWTCTFGIAIALVGCGVA